MWQEAEGGSKVPSVCGGGGAEGGRKGPSLAPRLLEHLCSGPTFPPLPLLVLPEGSYPQSLSPVPQC